MKIDVCIPTKDKKTLDIIKMNILILPINKIIVSDAKGLANARNELMSKVKTDWFLFIDDDISIDKRWWDKMQPYLVDSLVADIADMEMLRLGCEPRKIGAVNGFGYPNSKILKFIRKTMMFLRGSKYQRGFTSNTLIRTEAIKGINLNTIGRLEDLELQNKIKDKGYRWEFCDAECVHLKSPSLVMKEAYNDFKRLVKENGLFKAFMQI